MKKEDTGNCMGCLGLVVFCTLLAFCATNVITGFWNILLAFIIAIVVFFIGAIITGAFDNQEDSNDRRGRY